MPLKLPLPLLLAALMSCSPPTAAPLTSLADTAALSFSPSGKTMQAVPLTDAGVKCLDGSTPVVWFNQSSAIKDWVIQIGSQSITTSFCISEKTCALFAAPPTTPPPSPGPMPISNAGPQSDDCVSNQVARDPLCTSCYTGNSDTCDPVDFAADDKSDLLQI